MRTHADSVRISHLCPEAQMQVRGPSEKAPIRSAKGNMYLFALPVRGVACPLASPPSPTHHIIKPFLSLANLTGDKHYLGLCGDRLAGGVTGRSRCGCVQCTGACVYAAAAKSLQSCPTLCDLIDRSPPGSAIPGILQARTLEWVAISFSNAGK